MFEKIKFVKKLIKWVCIITAVESFLAGIGAVYLVDDLDFDDGSSSGTIDSNVIGITDSNIKTIYDEFKKNEGKEYKMDHSNLDYDNCMSYYDCSSWVIHCLSHAEITQIPDSTAQGIYGHCEKVEVGDRKAGDLIFLQNTYSSSNETITHVGIYLGKFSIDGEEAEWIVDTGGNASGGVKISKYDNGWWNGDKFYAFGRLKS